MPDTAQDRRARGRSCIARLADGAEQAVERVGQVHALLVEDLAAAHQMVADMVAEYRRAVWALHAVTRAKPLDGARKAADAYLQELGT